MIKPSKKQVFLYTFALISIGLSLLFRSMPTFVETFYSRGLFVGIRWFVDHTISYIPFPMIYLFFLVVFFLTIRSVVQIVKKKTSLSRKLFQSLYSLLAFASLLIVIFFWMWGYNYSRIAIEDQLGFTPAPMKVNELKMALTALSPKVIEARQRLCSSDTQITEKHLPKGFKNKIVEAVRDELMEHDIPAVSKAKPRLLRPKGLLKIFGAIGIYWPFVGESNIDTALHPLQWPEVLAHELSHAYGFGDEGTCSFLAFLALENSEDPFIRYAILLDYWRSLASNYLKYEKEDYYAYRKSLPASFIRDLDDINERSKKYKGLFPKLRKKTYNAYLKTQGIPEGIENYNRVLMLVESWKKHQAID